MSLDSLRLAMRQLVRAPVLSVVAVITLALGLGANCSIFAVIDAVLLRPLPFAGADRLVVASETQRGEETAVGPGQFTEWTRRSRSFVALAAQVPATFTLTGGEAPERLTASWVTPSYFRTLVMPPLAGRYFNEEEEQGGAHAVVLSEAFFERRFGGDTRIIGDAITLNGEQYMVVGVARRDFSMHADGEQLWALLALTSTHRADFASHWLRVIGLRRPGVSMEQTQRDLERVSRTIRDEHPADMTDRSARVADFSAHLVAGVRRRLVVVFGAVGMLLLLTCVNVANLLLARVSVRRPEIAIRTALGATRFDIVRQFVAEAVMLAVAGAALSLLVANVVLDGIVRLAPVEVPRLDRATIGVTTVLFLVGLTVTIGVALGVLSALRGTRGIHDQLRAAGRGTIDTGTRDRMRLLLVTMQVALSVALLSGATLFIRSGIALSRVGIGIDMNNLLTFRISLPYADASRIVNGFSDILTRLETVPGTRAVVASSTLPLDGPGVDVGLEIEGRVYSPGNEPSVNVRLVSTNYFRGMGIPLSAGRPFDASDRAGGAPAVIVSERLARSLFPNGDAIGKRVACCNNDGAPRIWREIIGVSGNVRSSLTTEPLPELYMPFSQAPTYSWTWYAGSLAFAVRSAGATPASLLPSIRGAVAAVDPTVPLWGVRTLDEATRSEAAANRFSAQLLSALSFLALILSSVGVYAILAFFVAERRREIGVRLTLGAKSGDILALVLRQGVKMGVFGIAGGLVLALVGSRALSSLLYGVATTDMLTYLIVSGVIALVVLLASSQPARRAAKTDPAVSLRS